MSSNGVGYEHREQVIGRPEDSAERWGNLGLPVLSTPAILGHMEMVCVRMITPHLAPDQMTVGVAVELRHLAPVPIGEPVDIVVRAADLGRRITVTFTVTDRHGQLVADGTHRRAVVNATEFRSRVDEGR